jgi:hypothetical protein
MSPSAQVEASFVAFGSELWMPHSFYQTRQVIYPLMIDVAVHGCSNKGTAIAVRWDRSMGSFYKIEFKSSSSVSRNRFCLPIGL